MSDGMVTRKPTDELLHESGHENKATAVREAVAIYLRQKKREKIKSMKDKLKFDKTAEELRHRVRQSCNCRLGMFLIPGFISIAICRDYEKISAQLDRP